MPDRPPPHRVLFVCVGNSTLSPMAEAFARHWGLDADSAGTMPGGEVSAGAIMALKERGIFLDPASRPKRIDFLRLADYERIIAMGPGVAATSPDLHTHEDWGLDDPVNLEFKAYRQVCEQIQVRVKELAREIREWTQPEQEAPRATAPS